MQFIKCPDSIRGTVDLTKRLIDELTAGKRVLWLVTGGSNIPAAVEIMEHIPTPLTNLLTITLTDERYGEPGHDDSNWQQLIAAGFQGKEAVLLPVLISGASLEQVTQKYDELLAKQLANCDVAVGLFGMGADGHIAGILPGTKATKASGLAFGYETKEYTRVTITFSTFEQLNAAYVLAFSKAKLPALTHLASKLPLNEQPAQILKKLPEAYIYNDQVGEK
jgi:6-phosphogluconolactonase/glucosamine-6-phosphate isomerase/deaminase